jgi:DtxR family Mn-dependent transcriptional regulator
MDFFTKVLCIDQAEASDAACKMEHAVSRTILDRLIRFVEFLEICPRGGESLIQGFNNHCRQEGSSITCSDSLARCLADMQQRQKDIEGDLLDTVPLTDLQDHQRGKILKIRGKGGISKQLAEMEITPGGIVEVIQRNAETGALAIKVRGYRLSLSTEEAAKILVERSNA